MALASTPVSQPRRSESALACSSSGVPAGTLSTSAAIPVKCMAAMAPASSRLAISFM